VTDEQTASFVDTLSAMDASTLKLILRALVFLGSLYKPAMELYATVDSYTFGSARYLVLFVVMIATFYLSMGLWFVLKSVFYLLYALYGLVMRLVPGAGPSAASVVKETVFQAPATAAATSGATGLAAKVAAGAVAGAGAAATAAGAAALSGAAGAVGGAGAHSGAGESADDEF
jgi:hypothetical protein